MNQEDVKKIIPHRDPFCLSMKCLNWNLELGELPRNMSLEKNTSSKDIFLETL